MSTFSDNDSRRNQDQIRRRRFLQSLSAGAVAAGGVGFSEWMTLHADEIRRQGRALILLWMDGGPSQFETFDPKPRHENGGGTETIATNVPGVRIASGWEQTASVMQEIALIRSMTNKEGNHQRATYQMHTGYIPSGSVKHPGIGSCVAQQLATPDAELPSVVSIGRTVGAGFLGVDYEPFVVNNPGAIPQNVATQQSHSRFRRRLGLLSRLEQDFARRGADAPVRDHQQLYDKASKLVLSPQTEAFNLSQEPAGLRERYGDTQFGKGCLLARRLVEAGVTFVEVRSSGWDTHQDNFERIREKGH